ncbi:proline-rich protein 4-like [Cornus florida]|uniref:proline-rich protein 4-like n=1 Tax=Cornus florida TaxID=4283 RepID=UPI00289CD0F4|nr:proline-rich protein 4-like [Cornus florida]
MGIHSLCQGALLCFWLSLILSVSFSYGGDNTVQVVGFGECADCKENNFRTRLKVTIDCKSAIGEFKTRGTGELNEEGKFKVSLPQEIVKDEKLEEECFAQLHSASATPCPAHDGIEATKVVFKSKTNGKLIFGLAGKLKFLPVTCISSFPSLTKLPAKPQTFPWKKPFPKFFGHHLPFPPKVFPPIYKKPLPPPIPIYKKPLPPPVPIYKHPLPPPVPIYKHPHPPPVPIYKKPHPPPVPIYKKPHPPPVPIYKKPLPPPVPIYKPKPKPPVPIYKPKPKPPVPIYKPKPKPPPVPVYKPKPKPPPVPVYKPKPKPPPVPVYKPKPKPPIVKPLPPPVPITPFPKFPPVYKKPCPPLPKLPKIPPKYFHHPKIGLLPPLPPFIPHP